MIENKINKVNPFDLPFTTIASNNGVVIEKWQEGIPLLVFPGLEGSGESCLHLIVPAITKLAAIGIEIQLCVVNYAEENHLTLEALIKTCQDLLGKFYCNKEVFVFSQSFGNLLSTKIVNSGVLKVKKLFMISPFTELPKATRFLAPASLTFTPAFLYQATIKPFGRYVFGPVSKNSINHPFFNALKMARLKQLKQQLDWFKELNFTNVYSKLEIPFCIMLGQRDRLVNIKKQIRYFSSLCSITHQSCLKVNKNNGHVIFLENEVESARSEIVLFFKD